MENRFLWNQEARLADVVAEILSNRGDAGLIDLNINQKQKTLGAGAYESHSKCMVHSLW
jgi:hypothetical protein